MRPSLGLLHCLTHLMLVAPFLASAARVDPVECDPDIPSREPPTTPRSLMKPLECGAGHYPDVNKNRCLPCPVNSFMTKMMVTRKATLCSPCLQAQGVEVISEPCTSTRDTTLSCDSYFYRDKDVLSPCRSRCQRCDACGTGAYLFENYEARACGGANNTLCCSQRSMVVENGVCRVPVATTASSLPRDSGTRVMITEIVIRISFVVAFLVVYF